MQKFSQNGSLNQVMITVFTLVVLLLIGGYFYTNLLDRGVSVEINLPEGDIYPGDIFDIDAVVINSSKAVLQNTRLTLNFPEGIRLLENRDRVNEVRELESEVGPGALVKETYRVVALPSESTEGYTIEAKANYSTESFSNDFERKKSQIVDIETGGFELNIATPEKVSIGERFPVKMAYKLPEKEGESLDKFLVLEGPSFRVVDANMEQVSENRWLLTDGDGQSINASILLNSKPSDTFSLKAKMVVELGGDDYIVYEAQSEVLLVGSSLALSVDLEDPKEFVSPGELLNYRVSYKNNTNVDLKDVLVKAELVGDMFDFSSINTSGTFNSLFRTVIWSSSNFGELRELTKGEEGSFNITIKTKPSFPINSANDKDFILKIKGSIESPTVIQGTNTDRTSNFANSEVSVSGGVNVEAKAYFRDTNSGITNEGPFPPKVGQPTEYTIHWGLVNSGTDIEDVTVRGHLESGVVFTGEVKGAGNNLFLDTLNNEIVWSVGKMSATQGVLGGGPEAIFQLNLTPDIQLVGRFAPLLGITSVSAKDAFTGVSLLGTDSALTTALSDDTTVGPNQGKVIQ